jgi:hypothetical protein
MLPKNRQDFTNCLKAIEESLKACNGQSEYPLYIKGEGDFLSCALLLID